MFYFTVGPAQLYPTCAQHVQDAFHMQLGSISHRSEAFRKIYQHTDEQLRALMQIPASHSIFFTASATEIWERMLFNLVEQHAMHFVQGAFSRKFYEFSLLLQKQPDIHAVPDGLGFNDLANVFVPDHTELLCLTQNETSSGIRIPETDLHALKTKHAEKLVCCDIVSAVPYTHLNYQWIDSAFFSVQKGMGMPPGLGVWIVNEACLTKAEQLEAKGRMIGAHFRLSAFKKNYKKFETPSTPNTLAIYVLGKIAEDMNRIGIDNIRKETEEKFELLYNFIQGDDRFSFRTEDKEHLSRTTIVCDSNLTATELNQKLNPLGMHVAGGYGEEKTKQIRIANFPSSSLADMQKLLAAL